MQKANGGDVVVLRSTGSNGYNDYLYSQLGITVNSVETIVITSAAGAINPYVLNKVANAEMIWFAGGDQFNYVSYFKNNALEDLINLHATTKHAPIGGTSAGMAILGNNYFSAQNGSITSAQALTNPYASNATLGHNDFLAIPFMTDLITDTHYDNPDRKGRQSSFLARLKTDYGVVPKGIACNEYVAVCIGNDGIAHVYGDYPNYQEFAYFIQPNCDAANLVENCQSGQALTWNFGGQALKVYKVPGTMNGTNTFDVNNWQNAIGSGGSWENWSVNNGIFSSVTSTAPNCLLNNQEFEAVNFTISPNPVTDFFAIDATETAQISIYDVHGQFIKQSYLGNSNSISTSELSKGIYFVKIEDNEKQAVKKIIKL
ncbi:T9SS type A sorting domain-containing protein [Flavobacterium sp. SUN052]|uniref:T9SS type A sorting domain-containing protein n=1 Tax=Flavobacterium sp. SUN052 TaxID=3002441 RepID=UPI00237D8CA1|nr:T9SS type A sorting domain-containing protein [Flavobacterium sp. SUN052]MEC4003775.1 T9SS type A sorting domain-containing protein [Flavobacterium sp. SUN052]